MTIAALLTGFFIGLFLDGIIVCLLWYQKDFTAWPKKEKWLKHYGYCYGIAAALGAGALIVHFVACFFHNAYIFI